MNSIHYGEAFDLRQTRLFSSWSYIKNSFAGDFEALSVSGALQEDGGSPVIWSTKQKFVLKVGVNGKCYAYKSYRKIRHIHKYMFRLSPCGFEARNYQLLADAGIPMAKLAAAGDVRQMFLLKNMFLVTEFAENFRDGRDFQPGGCLHDDVVLKEEYIIRNLKLLARCHDAGLIHGGFTPANLLYALRNTPDEYGNKLDLLWIDVATCRKISLFCPATRITGDFRHLFGFLGIGNEEIKRYLQIYDRSITRRRLPFEKLLKLCTAPGKKK